MPKKPRLPMRRSTSRGTNPCSSQACAFGLISVSTKRRTWARRSSCSSEKYSDRGLAGGVGSLGRALGMLFMTIPTPDFEFLSLFFCTRHTYTAFMRWRPKSVLIAAVNLPVRRKARAANRSKRLDKGHHLLALVGIGQRSAHSAEIVGHVRRVGGAGDDRGDPRVRQQVFQEKLRPAL